MGLANTYFTSPACSNCFTVTSWSSLSIKILMPWAHSEKGSSQWGMPVYEQRRMKEVAHAKRKYTAFVLRQTLRIFPNTSSSSDLAFYVLFLFRCGNPKCHAFLNEGVNTIRLKHHFQGIKDIVKEDLSGVSWWCLDIYF